MMRNVFWSIIVLLAWLTGCIAVPVPRVQEHSKTPTLASVLPVVGPTGYCSGVGLEPFLVVTARHCMERLQDVLVLGSEPIRPTAVWLGELDIALLRLDPAGPRVPVSPLSLRVLLPGNSGFVAGYGCETLGGALTLATRTVSFRGRTIDKTEIWNGTACHGDSGGGLFNRSGELVAIVDGVHSDSWGVASYIEAAPLSAAIDGMLDPQDARWVNLP